MSGKSFKIFPQFLTAIVADGGAFIYGMLLGWSAPTNPEIVENVKHDFWITMDQFAWVVAMMSLGAAVSCVFSGIFRSKIGTKMTILLFGIPITIGWILLFFSINPAMLMIGRFLCGVAAGCYCFIIPIYVGEITSKEIRGVNLSFFQVCLNLGVLFVFTIGYFATVQILNIVCGLITIFYSLVFLMLPESPIVLITKNREEEAKISLKRLRGTQYNFDAEFNALKKQNEDSKSIKKSFTEVFQTKSTKKAFIIIILQFFFFQMSGINVVLFYSTQIFAEAGSSLEPGISSIIVSSVQVISILFAIAFVDKFGRKVMLSFSNILMCFGLVGIASYFTLKDSIDVTEIGWLPVASLCVFMVGFSTGMGPVSYILLGELFLQEAKAFVAPIGQVVNFLLTFAMGLTFPLLTELIGIGPTFFMFSGFCFLALLFTIFLIPETKGKTMDEIQKILS